MKCRPYHNTKKEHTKLDVDTITQQPSIIYSPYYILRFHFFQTLVGYCFFFFLLIRKCRTYSALLRSRHPHLCAVSPRMTARVPREPAIQMNMNWWWFKHVSFQDNPGYWIKRLLSCSPSHESSQITRSVKVGHFETRSYTLCNSCKLLRDMIILLSSSTCLWNVRRTSSSCKKQKLNKHETHYQKKNHETFTIKITN